MKKTSKSSSLSLLLVFVVLAVVTDQLTKWWALSNLSEGESRPFVGDFLTLDLLKNPGAAFSMGEGSTWVFTIISLVVVVAILWYALIGRVQNKIFAALLGLVAGGAIGNLIDRLTQPPGIGRGHVVDFLNYNKWFVGNVADIWIVGGAIGLVIYLLVTDLQSNSAAKELASAPEVSEASGE